MRWFSGDHYPGVSIFGFEDFLRKRAVNLYTYLFYKFETSGEFHSGRTRVLRIHARCSSPDFADL